MQGQLKATYGKGIIILSYIPLAVALTFLPCNWCCETL